MLINSDFSTSELNTSDNYLTDSHENSSTTLKVKCKRIGCYSLGLCLLIGSWGAFFILGTHYDQLQKEYNNTLVEDI